MAPPVLSDSPEPALTDVPSVLPKDWRLPELRTARLVIAPLVAVLLATLVRLWLQPFTGTLPPFFTYYLAVVFSAWYGGGLSGTVAWLGGYLVASYFFLPPAGSIIPRTVQSAAMASFYSISSAVTILLFAQQRRLQAALHRHGLQMEEALRSEQAANEEIKTLNRRLRSAMRETHHRVKNNLQVISALVDLRMMDDQQTVPVVELERLNHHIRALAAIHDVLTQHAKHDSDLETMSAKEGIDKVVATLAIMLPDKRFSTHLDDIRIEQRHGASIAMVVNELVSNAVKHGGEAVQVRLSCQEGLARIEVSDDGPGFPSGFSPLTNANTGLELVEKLARWDLGGETQYDNGDGNGARVVVTFPLEPSLPASPK
jgi:two-component system, sensor histidine kinase PdtaS